MTDMNNDKKTAGAAPGPQAAPPAPPKTDPKRPAAAPPKEEKPVRRVGSITLGLCLIAVGVCFLLYYFAPGFNWLLVAKVGAPLALVALGVEVIWCAAHPGRWKYDFLAVFGCLVLMGGAFCLTLLPLFWQQVSPERRIQTESLKDEYEQALYGSLQDTKIQLFSVHTYMDTGYGVQPQTLAELNQPGVFLSLGIDLYGPYDRTADFAKDCALLRDAVKQVAAQWGPMPEKIEFEWVNAEETVKMSISLRDAVQMNWTAEQMAEQVYCWLDEDSSHSGSAYSGLDGTDSEENAAPEAPSAPESPEAPEAPEAPAPSDVVQATPAAADVPEAPEVVSARPVMPVIQFRMD